MKKQAVQLMKLSEVDKTACVVDETVKLIKQALYLVKLKLIKQALQLTKLFLKLIKTGCAVDETEADKIVLMAAAPVNKNRT